MAIDNENLSDIIAETEREERKDAEDLEKQFLERRIQSLRKLGKTEKEIDEQLERDKAEKLKYNRRAVQKEEREEAIKRYEDAAKAAATVEEQKQAEREAQKLKNAQVIADKLEKALSSVGSKLFDDITKSADSYGELLTDIQTRLLGSGKTYASVADMISKTFSGSPFFAMSDAMKNVQTFVKQGIAYNVELRSTLQTVSEKIAQTFDALDATLLRIVRIQQSDTTQARLGIESALTNFLNNQYRDTSYLASDINSTVTAALLEAESQMTAKASTEFEFETQKWLGSLYASGASQNLISQLAQGFGYLGSGDITSLTSNQSLMNLLVSAINRGGGKSAGDIITGQIQATDISSVMTGLYELVNEISKSDNIVALNQYAAVFGMTVSDLKSILNLTSEDIKTITNETLSYNEALQTVTDNLTSSALFSRTAGSEIFNNIYSNMIDAIGSSIGSSAGGYLGWQMASYLSEFLKGTTITMSPFGMGANIDIGEIIKSTSVMGAVIGNLGTLIKGISNLGGVNLSNLENVETVERGSLSSTRRGTRQSYAAYVGDTSESTIYKSANIAAETQASKVSDTDLDEQKKSTKDMQNHLKNIDDTTLNILRLLDSEGIVIRGRTGETSSNYFSNMANPVGIFNG